MINIKLNSIAVSQLRCLMICWLALSSCKAQTDPIENYKGKALLQADLSVFIDQKAYQDTSLENWTADRFNDFMQKLAPNGVSVAVAIPDKGRWQYQSGFIPVASLIVKKRGKSC